MHHSRMNLRTFVDHTVPVPHYGKEWYVSYYAYDPAICGMRKKRHCVCMSLGLTERRRRMAKLLMDVNDFLEAGGNPWYNTEAANSRCPFSRCLESYGKEIDTKLRANTRRDYRSRLNVLEAYIADGHHLSCAGDFNTSFCAGFLDYLSFDLKRSKRTRNNYQRWLGTFARHLIIHGYICANPVKDIPYYKEDEKKRLPLTDKMLHRLSAYLEGVDRHFLLACLMQYYTLIRPGELSRMKISDISISDMTVFVPAWSSKNNKDGYVGLNTKILRLMIELGVFSCPSSFYLFGRDMVPSETRGGNDQFNRRWKLHRDVLGWADCYQFYSLKDSGIRDLANSKGIIVARDQARHADIATTNKYVKQHVVHDCTKDFKGEM